MFYLFLAISVLLIALTLLAYLGSNYLLARRKPDPPASPADFDLAFEEIEFQSGDGTTLRGWFVPARSIPTARMAAPTVVICPGANGSLDADAAFLPWFHNLDLNVLIFDWRAHGRSDGQLTTLGYDERYDLIAAVEYAKARGAPKIGVLGLSMGGAVALSTAAICPDIDVVAADSAFVHIVTAVAAGLGERGLPDGLAYLIARLILVTAGLRLGKNLFEADPVRWIDRIAPRPLLLIYGGRDPFAPPVEVELLNRRAGEPKDIWRVPQAAHREIQALEPDAYRERLTRFFKDNLR
ncbi:MAG: alpha/beta hydrolase [Chloroflexi bacterium]|nr:alpha/beta hydrolase [Chloroflexota bacterium]